MDLGFAAEGGAFECDRAAAARSRGHRIWREPELLLIILLVLGAYFSRLTDLTIRGEESRWARVAQEMLDTGDWIVPRQQGQPFPDRPPLNSWCMILASRLTGELNLAAIRLPSVVATLLTSLLVYVYGRNFLSRLGALAAACAFTTMAQVLQLGRVAESDALLTLFISGAFLSWHYGYACRRNAAWAWLSGYLLTALAGLTKGPQGPVYFVAVTTVFLAMQRDWRFLFSRWHLAGLAVFLAVVGAWQFPFYLALDPASARAVWSEGGDVGSRFQYTSLFKALKHWASFPFEVFACMLPWSFMLPPLATRWFWRNLGTPRAMCLFLLTCSAIVLPTIWLPAESRARYVMCLYPGAALLVGAAIQRSWESSRSGWWERSWDRYLLTGVALMAVAAAMLPLARAIGGSRLSGLAQSVSASFTACYVLAGLIAIAVTLWSRHEVARRAELGIFALASYMGLSYAGVVVSIFVQTANNPTDHISAVRDLIPPGEHLVSFGRVHHLFAHYYAAPIELKKPTDGPAMGDTDTGADVDYFCFTEDPCAPNPVIPFDWESVAEISCERARSDHPRTKVVVGRRRADQRDADDSKVIQASTFPASTALRPIDRSRPKIRR